MYTLLKRINRNTVKLAQHIITISFTSMTIFVFAQVIFRYVLKQSLSWSEELATYLFIWLTFIGASVAMKERSHINVEIVISNIKNIKLRKSIFIFAQITSILFLIIVSYYGIIISTQLLALGKSSAAMPFLKVGLIYFAVPIGSLLMIMYLIEIIWDVLLDKIPIKGGHD